MPERILDCLVKEKIVSPPHRYVKSGHANISVCKLLIKE